MNKKPQFKISYHYRIRTLDCFGNVRKESEGYNTVVNDGLNRVRDLIGNVTNSGMSHIAIGTDNTSVTNTDSSLGAEVARESATIDTTTNFQVEYDNTFNFSSGVSHTIVEAGLFDQATESGSTMLNRFTFSGHSVDSDNPLQVTITITVSRP